jgi:RNA polymerase sigma-70 factor (ECF subfamily)
MFVPMTSEGPLLAQMVEPDEVTRSASVSDALADLARAAGQGDVRVQRTLCEAIAPALLAPVRSILGPSHPDVEDVLQDALVGALRGLRTFRGESSVLHFVRRIAAKRALDFRRRARTAAHAVDGAAQIPALNLEMPRDALVSERRRAHLRRLLDELPVEQSEALVMRAVLGHSIEEVSEATHTPINTVRSRLRLAKEALRARIMSDPALAELGEVNG